MGVKVKQVVAFHEETSHFYMVELNVEEFNSKNRKKHLKKKIELGNALRMFPHMGNVDEADDLAELYTDRFAIQNEEAKQVAINKAAFTGDYLLTLTNAIKDAKGLGLSEVLTSKGDDVVTSVREGM